MKKFSLYHSKRVEFYCSSFLFLDPIAETMALTMHNIGLIAENLTLKTHNKMVLKSIPKRHLSTYKYAIRSSKKTYYKL